MERDFVSEHRRRVKDKFLQNGLPKGAPPHEILEILLFYSIARKDTKVTAKLLLEKFGSLSNVFNATPEELQTVEGIGEHSAILLKLIPEIMRAYGEDMLSPAAYLNDSDEIGTYLLSRYAYFSSEEVFSVLSLNNKGRLISFNVIEKGDIGSVGVSTRKVIETLLNTKATSAVIAHNHPGGIALPSDIDLKITESLHLSLKSINVNLIDHIILADDDFVSLAQSEKFRDIFK